jgi:hypothetical protein
MKRAPVLSCLLAAACALLPSSTRPAAAAPTAATAATAPKSPDGSTTGCSRPPARRTAWLALAEAKFEVADAAERQRKAMEVLDCLADPDPKLRDGVGFESLYTWLRAGAIDAPTQIALAERVLPKVEAEEDAAGFQRPFAALVLAELVRADRVARANSAPPIQDEGTRQRFVAAAERFLVTTRDHRGFDATDGWRHAVAHGADLVVQLGIHPATTAAEARRLLDAVASQIAPPGVSYVFGEPDRLATAVGIVYGRGLLDEAFWDGWFAAVGARWKRSEGPAAYGSLDGLARRHDVRAFLHAVSFAARANPNPANEKLAALADRELMKM